MKGSFKSFERKCAQPFSLIAYILLLYHFKFLTFKLGGSVLTPELIWRLAAEMHQNRTSRLRNKSKELKNKRAQANGMTSENHSMALHCLFSNHWQYQAEQDLKCREYEEEQSRKKAKTTEALAKCSINFEIVSSHFLLQLNAFSNNNFD